MEPFVAPEKIFWLYLLLLQAGILTAALYLPPDKVCFKLESLRFEIKLLFQMLLMVGGLMHSVMSI